MIHSHCIFKEICGANLVWEITLLGSVLLECHGFYVNEANFVFGSSMRLIRCYSIFQNFYVLPYIHFLSVELAGVAFFPLINTDDSIPVLKKILIPIVFLFHPQRISLYMQVLQESMKAVMQLVGMFLVISLHFSN